MRHCHSLVYQMMNSNKKGCIILKNLNYFPFERNRYFYGKLLTVNDFESEQKYFNDKRRMLNRFLFGSGVVSGMDVVRVDDNTISVEMGLALDFSGREIVIDTPVIKKLSMIEGFDSDVSNNQESGYMYLCIDYAEEEKEPVHNIASSGAKAGEQGEFNKFAEGYKLYLTTNEPENEAFTCENFYRDTQTIYWGNGIRIKQKIARYVKSSNDVEVVILVDNMGQQQPFSFEYDVNLVCLQHNGTDKLKVSFDEKNFEKKGKYAISYKLKAMDVKNVEGKLTIVPDSFKLNIAQTPINAKAQGINICKIAAINPKKELINKYYKTGTEEIVKNTFGQSIYLAKISVIKAGSAYVIDSIEKMPFNQYVMNNILMQSLSDIEMDEMEKLSLSHSNNANEDNSSPNIGIKHNAITSGSTVIDLGIGGNAGQKFYSKEIAHGLGLGPVFISLCQAVSLSEDSDRYFGDADIFEDKNNMLADVKLGAKVNVKDGTFIIGAKMNTPTNARKLKVDWIAIKDYNEEMNLTNQKQLLIKPDIKEIGVRENCYFEAIFKNANDKRVKWSLKEATAGSIDANGMYTAPNMSGVFEVVVESLAYPELKASTYVIVKENKAEKLI